MISLLLSIAIGQSALKDIHILATPVDKALIQIGQTYGVTMDASPVFRNKIVVIDAQQVSEKDLREQLAKTLDGTWEWKETYWHLTQTSPQKKLDDQRQLSFRSKMLKRSLDHRLGVEVSTAPFTTALASKSIQRINANGGGGFFGPSDDALADPDNRFMTRFLKKFGLERIVVIKPGRRQVFALKPNQMQAPLGIDVQSDVQQYQRERELWKQISDKFNQRAGGFPEDQEEPAPIASLDNVLFTVYCTRSGQYELQLVGLPADMRKFVFSVDMSSNEGVFADMKDGEIAGMETEGFKPSEEALDFRKFAFGQKREIQKDRLKSRLESYADPVTRDPLSYGYSEALVFSAKKQKRNLIAAVTDGGMNQLEESILTFASNKKFRWLTEDFVDMDDAWIRIMPFPQPDPNYARAELKQTIRRIREAKTFSVGEQARLAARLQRNPGSSALTSFLTAFSDSPDYIANQNDALRTLGLISDIEWQNASQAGGVPYSHLSADLRQHLFECAFHDNGMNLHPREGSRFNTDTYLFVEPTLLAPFGIPVDAPFFVTTVKEDVLKQDDTEMDGEVQAGAFLSARQWGEAKYFSEHPELELGAGYNPALPLRRYIRAEYRFRLILNERCQWQETIHRLEPVEGAAFTFANLPDDLRKAFEEGYRNAATYKKRDGDGK